MKCIEVLVALGMLGGGLYSAGVFDDIHQFFDRRIADSQTTYVKILVRTGMQKIPDFLFYGFRQGAKHHSCVF